MINGIINGICVALHRSYPDCTIYTEKVRQGLNLPCFFVANLSCDSRLSLGLRYFENRLFVVRFIPKSDTNDELNSVMRDLPYILEYISVDGDLLRGSDMRCECVDGVLHFYINYNGFVYRVLDRLDNMQDLEVSGVVKSEVDD